MYLTKIELTNFRNIVNQNLTPSPGLNIILGENAQGKTNLIEALNLLVSTKSFKANRDAEMIAFETEFARVFGSTDHTDLEILIRKTGKELTLNNLTSRALDVVGVVGGVLFTPSDIELLTDTPASRRRFLDILISKINRKYLYDLMSYTQVLKSRNRLLYFLRERGESKELADQLLVWTNQLVESGSNILSVRLDYIKRLNKFLEGFGISLLGYPSELVYTTKFKQTSPSELKKEFQDELEKIRREEIEKTNTLVGPHRDDFKIIVKPKNKGIDIGVYGSRGEVRSALLGLKMSELALTQEEKKDKVILILDDVLSELDETHQRHLLDLIKDNQTFLTTTSLDVFRENLKENTLIWKAKSGAFTT